MLFKTTTTTMMPDVAGLSMLCLAAASTAAAAAATTFTDLHTVKLADLSVLPLPFTSRNYSSPWPALSAASSAEPPTSFNATFEPFNNAGRAILGESPKLTVLVHEQDYAFAHEAPVYFGQTGEVFFCSDAGGKQGRSNATVNNVVWRGKLAELVEQASNGTPTLSQSALRKVNFTDAAGSEIQMTNGGTPYGDGHLLLANSGRGEEFPGGLSLTSLAHGGASRILLNNAFSKQFNAPNDVVVHTSSGSIWFTDADYAQTQNFRPDVELPKATWRFHPQTGDLDMVDASVVTPNGLVFSPNQRTLYITETGSTQGGDLPNRPKIPAVIYAFDVVRDRLENKRIFAAVPTGIADGIKVDIRGNVYACTADGLYAWSSAGRLLARVYIPDGGCVNLAFVEPKGHLLVTAQTRLLLIELSGKEAVGPKLDGYPSASKRISL